MQGIKFKRRKSAYIHYEGRAILVHNYTLVYSSRLTSGEKSYTLVPIIYNKRHPIMSPDPLLNAVQDPAAQTSPGLTLQEWLEASNLTYRALSRLIPCSLSYPRLIAQGLARPSYEMAIRIEEISGGLVPRTNWYPAPTAPNTNPLPVDIEELLK